MHPLRGPRQAAGILAVVVAAAVLAAGIAPAAAAPAPGTYVPPVDAPVHDPFRPPANPYAAGNRGIDYTTEAGTAVRAAAGGEVAFAGPVGGSLHVVVLHPDGLRTSYSFLASIAVARGQVVARGDVVGTTGTSLHFGVRAGDRYLDPALLLAGGPVEVHLVPLEARRVQAPDVERRWLVEALARAGGVGTAAGRWLASRGGAATAEVAALAGDVLAATAARRVALPLHTARTALAARRALAELLDDQDGCTPASEPVPPAGADRRIVVLVAGYGSTGGDAEVLAVDTDALGYAPADRVQYSYAGGRVPGVGALDGVPVAGYGPTDAMGDLRAAGRRLRRLLDDIAAAHPGVPVDVVAHSQGGLVARQALAAPAGGEHGPTQVEHLVTLGTPHHGATLASLAGRLGLDEATSALGAGLAAVTGGGVDPGAPSVRQMAEGSRFLVDLGRRHLPDQVRVTSIAASGDLVVPALSSTLAGATNALVPMVGATAHGRLPGSPEAARSLALALGGRAPACTSTVALVAGAALAAAVRAGEEGVASAVAPGVVAADNVMSWLAPPAPTPTPDAGGGRGSGPL